MALPSTIHHVRIGLSDVERGVYESLDLRIARHPSESFRYLALRTLAYCLNFEEGIQFSRGGLSSTEEPPLAVVDATGVLRSYIDVGSPSAERLHKAAKSAARVVLYTAAELVLLRREANSRPVHRLAEIEVWQLSPSFLDQLEPHLTRNCSFDLLRNEGRLYVTFGAQTFETPLVRESLVETAD
jgi:uncharacterized protein YaeQ